jgi:hypothetical protein
MASMGPCAPEVRVEAAVLHTTPLFRSAVRVPRGDCAEADKRLSMCLSRVQHSSLARAVRPGRARQGLKQRDMSRDTSRHRQGLCFERRLSRNVYIVVCSGPKTAAPAMNIMHGIAQSGRDRNFRIHLVDTHRIPQPSRVRPRDQRRCSAAPGLWVVGPQS